MHGQAELIAIAAPKLCNGPDLVLLDKAVQEFSLVLCELAIRAGTRVASTSIALLPKRA